MPPRSGLSPAPTSLKPANGVSDPDALLARARRQVLEITRAHCFCDLPPEAASHAIVLDAVAFHDRLRDALDDRALHRAPMVVCIQLDGADAARDRHGLDAADAMLGTACGRLSRLLSPDDAVGRGSEGRVVCLVREPGTLEQAVARTTDLLDSLSMPCEVGASRLPLLPSIGAASFPRDGGTPYALLMCAEAALNRARHYGMGYAFYTGVLDAAFTTLCHARDSILLN